MPNENRKVRPGRRANSVLTDKGEELVVPPDWALLPPGDGVLTKLVKAKGPTWLVQIKVGRRLMSQGIWANKGDILSAGKEITAKRAAPDYDLRRERQRVAKVKKQQKYVFDFYGEVLRFLNFHPRFSIFAEILAEKVTAFATPIGSGTVARTERIPLADRAQAAVIAWMRHQVTSYDKMSIARVKGRRREIRRELADQSVRLLIPYRQGQEIPSTCPLYQILRSRC